MIAILVDLYFGGFVIIKLLKILKKLMFGSS